MSLWRAVARLQSELVPGDVSDVPLQQRDQGVVPGRVPAPAEVVQLDAVVGVEVLEHVGIVEEGDARPAPARAGRPGGHDVMVTQKPFPTRGSPSKTAPLRHNGSTIAARAAS